MLSHSQTRPIYFYRVKISIFQTPCQVRVFYSVLFQQPIKVVLMLHTVLGLTVRQWVLYKVWLDLHILVVLCNIDLRICLCLLYSDHT
jgi:hypothetical protein